MYDLALNVKTNDLILSNGDLMIINNAERVAQQIRIKLKAFKEEWFLDNTFGVPYFESIFVKSPSEELIRNILRAQIKEVNDVESVDSLSLSIDNATRTLEVDFEASTLYGMVTGKEVLGYE